MDDIFVYGKTFDDQLENPEAVLIKLKSKGIKLNVSKCNNFFKWKVKYLGQIISKDGYQADPDDAVALENVWKPPKTVRELRSLLGFLKYYQGYVKNFSIILKPLYDLLKVENNSLKIKEPNRKRKLQTHSQLDSGV